MSNFVRYMHLKLDTPTMDLLKAIDAGDREKFANAIAAGADVDAADGEPLVLAAEKQNYAFAKLLWEKDANIHLPLARMKKESAQAYQKYRETPAPLDQQFLKRRDACDLLAARLQSYRKGFSDLAAQRNMSELTRIANALEALRETAIELMGPQRLDKVATPALHTAKDKPGLS